MLKIDLAFSGHPQLIVILSQSVDIGMFKRGKVFYLRTQVRGKEVWRSLGADHQEALRKYRQIMASGGPWAAFEAGQGSKASRKQAETVGDIGERWLTDYVGTRRNAKGQRLARSRFETYAKPALGDLAVDQVKPEDCRRLRLRLETQRLSPQTVAHVLSDVRCLFRYAADELRLIPRSPFPSRLMPRVEEVAPRRLSGEEIQQVLESLPDSYGFVVSLALATGLRWGEIQRLQWRHVEWSPPHLVVERTKSGKVRRVPLAGPIVDELKSQFARSGSVFVSPFRNEASGSFNRYVRRKTGVIAFSFHRLRHTFASRWLEAGGSKEALQKILGHSTIRLTEIYGKVSDIYVLKEAEDVAAAVAVRKSGVRSASKGH